MLRVFAFIFAAIFILAGIFGFIPEFTPDGFLLGIFQVNAAHNIVHLASGVVALWCGLKGRRASRLYFQIFGIVYGVIAALGFFYGAQPILGFLANNIADAWFHTIISLVSLYLGFVYDN